MLTSISASLAINLVRQLFAPIALPSRASKTLLRNLVFINLYLNFLLDSESLLKRLVHSETLS
jgi:hypothetical protein